MYSCTLVTNPDLLGAQASLLRPQKAETVDARGVEGSASAKIEKVGLKWSKKDRSVKETHARRGRMIGSYSSILLDTSLTLADSGQFAPGSVKPVSSS